MWGDNDFTGYMQFTPNGYVTYSGKPKDKPTNSGRWNLDGGKLQWRFAGPDDIRTFVVNLPLKRSGTPGVITPEGQGWFNMSRA